MILNVMHVNGRKKEIYFPEELNTFICFPIFFLLFFLSVIPPGVTVYDKRNLCENHKRQRNEQIDDKASLSIII